MFFPRALRIHARTLLLRRRTYASMAGTLSINASRINEDLMTSCQWGSTPDGGMNRLTLNDDDKKVRDWFVQEVQKYGCSVTIDAVGNIFATRPGTSRLPPIALGSHLDTQPAGGKYDGIVGVHSALEVLKTLHEANAQTYAPLAVVNWANEEGARFPPAMLGSGVWAGVFSPEFAYAREDQHGATYGGELDRIGYRGATPAHHESVPLSAHFEVHIEQGPVLESEGKQIGVVTGVQAISWFDVHLRGRAAHTGTTPYGARADTLLAFADAVRAVRDASARLAPSLASVTTVTAAPQSINTLASDVRFSIDARAPDDGLLADLEGELQKAVGGAAEAQGVQLAGWTRFWHAPSTQFDKAAVGCVRAAAEEVAPSKFREMRSGAGHDSVHTALRCPTAMVFIPCRDGVSHNPAEFATPEDIAAGAQVLLGAFLRYDALLRAEADGR